MLSFIWFFVALTQEIVKAKLLLMYQQFHARIDRSITPYHLYKCPAPDINWDNINQGLSFGSLARRWLHAPYVPRMAERTLKTLFVCMWIWMHCHLDQLICPPLLSSSWHKLRWADSSPSWLFWTLESTNHAVQLLTLALAPCNN